MGLQMNGQIRVVVVGALLLGMVGMIACSGADLRGRSLASPDGKTYLVVEDNNGGECGELFVDGQKWQYPLHQPGPVEPGIHTIRCGLDEGGAIQFEVQTGRTFYFDYWGP